MEMLQQFRASTDGTGRITGVTHGVGGTDPAFQTQLTEYLKGDRHDFELDFDLRVSSFQHAVLAVAQSIPYGETRTYQWVAEEVGRAGAAQAVGQALTRNPLLLVIPCHRVVPKAGGVGGYAAGTLVKVGLLALERSPHLTVA